MTTTHPSANDSGLNLDHLAALARAATPGPWSWWTSNSTLRLTGADGRDGGVLYGYARQGDGDVNCALNDQTFIAAANPAAVLELIALARRAALANQPAPTDWQTAHADMVKRNALLRERPDLPVDRIPVHAELMRLQEENARLRANQPAPTVPADGDDLLKSWPNRIWLQAGETDEREEYETLRQLGDGITWADSSIDRFDVEYVRADLVAHQPAQEQAVPYGHFIAIANHDGSTTTISTRDNDPEAFVLYRRAAQQEPVAAPQKAAAPGVLDDLDFTPDAHYQVADMANVGYELMQAIKVMRPDYCWNDTPAEIVSDLINELDEATTSAPGTPEAPRTAAARDVLAERQRQVKAEGYDHENDDNYVNDEMAAAAAFYVMPPGVREWPMDAGYGATMGQAIYPDWMPPKIGDRRRDLVKGAALALAEIERLDRAAAPKGGA
jgi:hypothetical protein